MVNVQNFDAKIYQAACNKMAEGDEADIVLLYACCGIRCQKVKGAGADRVKGSTKQEA
jgi:hypothetical protein